MPAVSGLTKRSLALPLLLLLVAGCSAVGAAPICEGKVCTVAGEVWIDRQAIAVTRPAESDRYALYGRSPDCTVIALSEPQYTAVEAGADSEGYSRVKVTGDLVSVGPAEPRDAYRTALDSVRDRWVSREACPDSDSVLYATTVTLE